MSHFFTPLERALLRLFGKTEKDLLILYGKLLVGTKRQGLRNEKAQDRQGSEEEAEK